METHTILLPSPQKMEPEVFLHNFTQLRVKLYHLLDILSIRYKTLRYSPFPQMGDDRGSLLPLNEV